MKAVWEVRVWDQRATNRGGSRDWWRLASNPRQIRAVQWISPLPRWKCAVKGGPRGGRCVIVVFSGCLDARRGWNRCPDGTAQADPIAPCGCGPDVLRQAPLRRSYLAALIIGEDSVWTAHFQTRVFSHRLVTPRTNTWAGCRSRANKKELNVEERTYGCSCSCVVCLRRRRW